MYAITAYIEFQNEFIKEFKNKPELQKILDISDIHKKYSHSVIQNEEKEIIIKNIEYYLPYLDKRFKFIYHKAQNIKYYITNDQRKYNKLLEDKKLND